MAFDFTEFAPPRWMRGRHAQTILPSLLPARRMPGSFETLDVPVGGASKVRVLITRSSAAAARGTVLLVHGLSGSAESGYMRRTGALALAHGWNVARLNLRNCGGTEALATTLYNAGQSGDADAVLAAMDAVALPRPHALIGFSLGGNIAMLYAGGSRGACRADVVVGVNPPVDLQACIDAVEASGNALYHAHFTRSLCAQLRRIRRLRAVPGPEARPSTVGGIRGFDDAFTAPDAGFASASEYYREASAAPRLSGIRRPALILSSKDDPLVPVAMFAAHAAASRHLRIAHPACGGHCGYWAGRRPRFWAAEAALQFIESSKSAA